MAIEDAIYSRTSGYAAVSALVGARVYPDTAPQDAAMPYIVFTRISTVREPCVQGYTGGLAHPRFQFDVFATSAPSKRATAEALRQCWAGYAGVVGDETIDAALLLAERDLPITPAQFARETPIFRAVLDFEIWHGESVPAL